MAPCTECTIVWELKKEKHNVKLHSAIITQQRAAVLDAYMMLSHQTNMTLGLTRQLQHGRADISRIQHMHNPSNQSIF
jgi:hypothetical protein